MIWLPFALLALLLASLWLATGWLRQHRLGDEARRQYVADRRRALAAQRDVIDGEVDR